MDLLVLILLAMLQGIVEFLPISSSGHLILVPSLFGWPDQGLPFDVAVHFGTLLAVVVYYWRDLKRLAFAWGGSLAEQRLTPDARLAWLMILGTVPIVLAGLVLSGWSETQGRNPMVIAAATAVFGILLWVADRLSRRSRDEHSLTVRDVIIIGIAQAVAIIPGTSRSGITMTAGLALGLNRVAAARFSFLLSVPAITLASLWQAAKLLTEDTAIAWAELALAAGISAVTAYLGIAFLIYWVSRAGMGIFVVYRLALACVIVYVLG